MALTCSSSLCSPTCQALQLGVGSARHTQGTMGGWIKEGGACLRPPTFQEPKDLCENGTWFHSSGRRAEQGGGGRGALRRSGISDGLFPSLGLF